MTSSTTRRAVVLVVLVVLAMLGSGCAAIAVASAPTHRPTPQTERGRALAEQFWSALHGGHYEQLDELLELHARVALDEPSDPITISHLGWLHAWALAESARAPKAAAVTFHIPLARRYFEEAVTLVPDEPRYLGFLASFTLAEGSVMANERVTRQGYFQMKDAIAAWPEFNLFTSGYMVSAGPVDEHFREGLEQQWQTLEVCFGSREVPTRAVFARETRQGHQRACWNSWIAPHNWEGFFLNFGDMLVRAGDLPRARQLYEAAKLSQTYGEWPYREVLERRLSSLDELAPAIAAAPRGEVERTTMFNSSFACTGCHQGSGVPR